MCLMCLMTSSLRYRKEDQPLYVFTKGQFIEVKKINKYLQKTYLKEQGEKNEEPTVGSNF